MRLATICVMGIAAAAANADTVDLEIFENADNANVAGLDINVEITGDDDNVSFTFANESSIDGFVTSIYIEATDFTTANLSGGAIGAGVGDVDFVPPATPPSPPGSISATGGAWGGNIFSADHESGMANKWAIHAGESLAIDFDLGSATFQDLVDALDAPEFRFAAHIQGVGPDAESSVWATNGPPPQVVPLPPAAAAGLGLLGAIGAVRVVRRR